MTQRFLLALATLGMVSAACAASCSGDVTVFTSSPSKLCENDVFDESGTPIQTGDACVDECLRAIAVARDLALSLADGASEECDTFAEDFDLPRTWADNESILELAADACSASLVALRETSVAIDCETSQPTPCGFETSCQSPAGSTEAQIRTTALLEARVPGLFAACCLHEEAVDAYEVALDACQACPLTRRVDVCLRAALSVAALLGAPVRQLGNTCALLENFE